MIKDSIIGDNVRIGAFSHLDHVGLMHLILMHQLLSVVRQLPSLAACPARVVLSSAK